MTQYEIIHNVQTGEITQKEYTKEQIEDSKKMQAEADAKAAELEAKAAVKASALAKLAALGLSADEIAAL
jgi:vacuolar-type H+-ATPase subunit H